jgi:hypothetical protein
MTSTFAERSQELRRMVGSGQRVTGSVVVDQRYAQYQHERLDLHHPRGGRAKYLEGPLYDGYRTYLGWYAAEVLRDGGIKAIERAMGHLSDQVEVSAPREFEDLMRSGHPVVKVGPKTVYDRPPHVSRLNADQLRGKSRLRMRALIAAGRPWFFTRHGKVVRVPGKGEPR